ncbi:putative transporter slc-17.2 [Chionoecetes opilio]|uniref:Putative transporter slc-17.2 n=1 Tax=Chionoecetes opilio TaxID=41210 RepID=A0A8J4Y8T1_CHIOP|nr:putative transporter slc-17.2 [Chionoecetes opilio]
MALAGWLCEMEWLGGWPLPFYVVGAAGLVWYALWVLLVHPTPEEHPRITRQELQYIMDGRRRVTETKKFPWGPFLRSPAVWVQTLAGSGDTFSMYIILTMLPTYLTNMQHFSLRNAGVIAALPYLLSCLVSVGWGHVIGCLTAAHILTTRRTRQLSMAIGKTCSSNSCCGNSNRRQTVLTRYIRT